MKVLFVEDPLTIPLEGFVARVTMQFPGTVYQCVTTSDEAVAWAREHRPEMVVVRGRSRSGPMGDGPGIITRIRAIYQPTREIILTGGASHYRSRLEILDKVQRVHVVQTPDLHLITPLIGCIAAPPSRIVIGAGRFVASEIFWRLVDCDCSPAILSMVEHASDVRSLLRGSSQATILVLGDGLRIEQGESLLSLLSESCGHRVSAVICTATPSAFEARIRSLSKQQPIVKVVGSNDHRALENVMDGWVPRHRT